MTPEQLAAIKARALATHKPPTFCGSFEGCHFTDGAGFDPTETLDALTAAREDVPALLAEVERLRAAVAGFDEDHAAAFRRGQMRARTERDEARAEVARLRALPTMSDDFERLADERDAWKARAEKAEAQVAAVEALCDEADKVAWQFLDPEDVRAAIAEAGGAS